MEKAVNSPIASISDFIFACTEIQCSDVILIPGGSHPQLMQEAARLYKNGFAPLLLPSGGANPNLPSHDSEWQFLKELGISLGIPADAILKEDQAANTFANARLSCQVLSEKGIAVSRAILVCKAFHARRALLTYQYYFSAQVEFFVAPVTDGRGITKENWYLNPNSVQIVMDEVRLALILVIHHGIIDLWMP